MTRQGALDFTRRPTRADQIFQRFAAFHRANPTVWYYFQRFADEMRRRRAHYSADAILHRVRWELNFTIDSSDGLRINDHYSAYYARLYALSRRPEADGFFETRRRKSAEQAAARNDVAVFRTGPAGSEVDLDARLEDLL